MISEAIDYLYASAKVIAVTGGIIFSSRASVCPILVNVVDKLNW